MSEGIIPSVKIGCFPGYLKFKDNDMNTSFLFLADGFEEIEALTAVDVLRRAGMDLKTVSITSVLQVKGAHGVVVTADLIFDNTLFAQPEWLILPGGMPGASNLYEFAPLQELLKKQAETSGRIAAICAAPAVVLGQLGLLDGKDATCYPGFEGYLQKSNVKDNAVVVSDNFVLGNGPANALPWAITIVKEALGEEVASQVADGMLFFSRDADMVDNYYG